ncbi:MAG TPA: PGF-pre-PGF domain-containing protein [Candidatus Methanoperedenaceae archaeon]|nr:PGF-pre-PGF domain-containing protein [Candidatus Methanoperedenaceae archaeon]
MESRNFVENVIPKNAVDVARIAEDIVAGFLLTVILLLILDALGLGESLARNRTVAAAVSIVLFIVLAIASDSIIKRVGIKRVKPQASLTGTETTGELTDIVAKPEDMKSFAERIIDDSRTSLMSAVQEPDENVESRTKLTLVPDDKKHVSASLEGTHVNLLDFTSSSKEVNLVVEKLHSLPRFARTRVPALEFEILNIWADSLDLKDVVLGFKVDKQWIEKNNVEEVQLYRLLSDRWEAQHPIEKLGDDAKSNFYGAYIRDLNASFAIAGKVQKA